ncbi:MAG: hypothetical protein K5637_07545 [Lachnospiraceae bacterium]|nr:hypothetical protein [Lachnospiraceae bacterium]
MADNNPFFFNPFMNNPFLSANSFMNGAAAQAAGNPFFEQAQKAYQQWADQAQQYAAQAQNAFQPYADQAQQAYKQWADQAQQYAAQAQNAFQPYVDQAQQAYKQWADQAQQYAAQAQNAFQPYADQAQQAYKAWADQAQKYAAQAQNAYQQYVAQAQTAFQPYADQAQQAYKAWADQAQKYAAQAQTAFQPYVDQAQQAYKAWADQFQNGFRQWADMSQNAYQQMAKALNPSGEGFMNPMDMYKAVLDNYQEMSSRMTSMIPGLDSISAIYKNFIPDTSAFTQLADLWKGLGNPQEYMQNFTEKYTELMNNFYKTSPVFGNIPMLSDPQKLIETCIDFYRSVMAPWMDIDQELTNRALNGDTTAYLEFFKSINEKYDESFGKLFTMEGFGINREANADYMHAANNFYKFMYSGAELFTMIQNKMKEAGQKLVEKYQAAVKEGQNITTLRGFYDLWYNTNEDALLELFNTDEYSQVFAAFSDKYHQYLIAQNKVYERMLAFLPIPTDTDMKALYKTVYDLRKDVRDLKKAAAAEKETKETKETKKKA